MIINIWKSHGEKWLTQSASPVITHIEKKPVPVPRKFKKTAPVRFSVPVLLVLPIPSRN